MPIAYGCTFDLAPTGCGPADGFLGAIREWVGARWPDDQPWFQPGVHAARRLPDGSIVRWEPYEGAEGTLWEFIWRHPDRDRAGVEWTTNAVLYRSDASPMRLLLRVANTGPGDGPARIPTIRPRLVK
jgi:hypothetical protein